MKLRKGLFMLCAGLSLCACSSDDGNQFPEGIGMVEVKVVSPQARAIGTGSTGSNIIVNGDITITLEGTFIMPDGSESTEPQSITLSPGTKAKFWNVKTPQKVYASVNNGKSSYKVGNPEITENRISNMQQDPISVPAYGEITPTLSNNSASPVQGETGNVNFNEGDQSKIYQVFTASIQLEIPVARLEVSNISLSSTSYSSLNLKGVYLDNIREYGPSWSEGNFKSYDGNPTDYAYKDGENVIGSGSAAILCNVINTELVNATLPTGNNQVYAYNFYGAPKGTTYSEANALAYNPSFKLYFDNGTSSETVSFPRFAYITNYKRKVPDTDPVEYENIVLENGTIYKVIGATLTDDKILTDESGNALFGVEVTVTQASWTIEEIYADWAE